MNIDIWIEQVLNKTNPCKKTEAKKDLMGLHSRMGDILKELKPHEMDVDEQEARMLNMLPPSSMVDFIP